MNNNLVGAINFSSILLSIPIVAAGIWLSSQPSSACLNLLHWPIIILGLAFLLTAIAGFVGAFCRLPWLLFVYMVVMVVLLLVLACVVAFIYVVSTGGSGHLVPGRAYLEYRLEGYSGWMEERVRGNYKWNGIKTCLASSSLCSEMNETFGSAQEFFRAHLSPLQSGCCKPPTQCGFTLVRPTVWINPINPGTDVDCRMWSNEQSQVCYSCSTCKAGVLETLKRGWRKVDIVLLVTLVLLVSIYVLGYVAFRKARTQEIFRRYKQGYT